MRSLLLVSFIFFYTLLMAQDTTIVQTFTLDSTSRAGVFTFPDDPVVIYEKIIMQYRMRCHDAAVGNGNVGCREWDYHCNTILTDSSLTDSIWSTHPNYIVSGSSSNPYTYIFEPTFNYIWYVQQEVLYNLTMTEDSFAVVGGEVELNVPFQTEEEHAKTYVLYTAEELQSSGMISGNITGMRLWIEEAGSEVVFLKVKMKHTDLDELDPSSPSLNDFTEVYFLNTSFSENEKHSFNFYQPFNWNGTENILIEYSFTAPAGELNTSISGEELDTETRIIHTTQADQFLAVNNGDYVDVPAAAFEDLDSLITVSFWQYGDPNFQPFNSYIFEGADENNNRVINSHLPWSNGRVYWDAGNSGTGNYDRIDKEAAFEDYAGQWNHWAMTKNAISGEMKMYLNGELWHAGTDKFRSMEGINSFKIAGNKNAGQYAGYINEFRIWNVELDETTIQEWMYTDLDNTHPDYENLLIYYRFNVEDLSIVTDEGPGAHHGIMGGQPLYVKHKGHQLSRNFTAYNFRPNIEFIKGIYSQTINESYFLDSLQRPYNTVYSYYVENNDLFPFDTNTYWEAGYMPVYSELGDEVDSIYVDPSGEILIGTMEYYRKWPARYELLSFITPYGNGLDLGEEGGMWEFDVSDFGPVLQGDKYLSIEGVGKWSEELDIRFLYIEGTPPRDVLTINPIWPIAKASQAWYGFGPTAIDQDLVFEPREILMNPEASYFKVRSAITGHGQNGEFTSKWHYINVDGDDWEYEYKVWNECATIPVYPQGGTWIFDRAGWCPGDPTTLFELDITEYISPGEVHTLDYGLTNIAGLSAADYRIANQLVTYGPANFSLDASVIEIRNPNSELAAHMRFNPACTDVEVIIQNTGITALTSLEIEYLVVGGEAMTYEWSGELAFLEKENVILPIADYTFWYGSENTFQVSISNPNGGTDEYSQNNTKKAAFETTDVYDIDESLEIHCKTNNLAYQTSYYLEDASGNIIFERDNLENTTIYTDFLDLEPGCYKLRIDDTADNGLYFWFNTGQGTGYLRLKNSAGYILENFEPEFGKFAEYEFAIVNISGRAETIKNSRFIGIFPNPANEWVNIELTGYEGCDVEVSIFNSSMNVIQSSSFQNPMDKTTKRLSIDHLSAGVYYVRVIAGNKVHTQKLIKM